MNTLKQQYNALNQVYTTLDKLIKTALFKAVRSADEWLEKSKKNQPVKAKKWDEDTCDFIAYNDAINRRFELYCQLMYQFLSQYLHEKYKLAAHKPESIIKACLEHDIISKEEYDQLLSMIQYACSIDKPCNIAGDYECSEELLFYTVLMNDIMLRLDPALENIDKSLIN